MSYYGPDDNEWIQAWIEGLKRARNKLCPQGWAWLIGDCDHSESCASCDIEESPGLKERRR